MPGEKFYSFAISTRGLDEVRLLSGAPKIKSKFIDYEFVQNDHIIPYLPATVNLFSNGVLADVVITESNFEIHSRGPLNFDSPSKKLIISVLDQLIIKDREGRLRVNLDFGAIANAWYHVGYELHTGQGGLLFIRRD